MTKLLDKALDYVRTLSEEEQDELARELLARFDDGSPATRARLTGSLTSDEIEAIRVAAVPSEDEQKKILADFAKAAG